MRQALDRAKSRPLGAALAAGGLATASMTLATVGLAGGAQAADHRQVDKKLMKGTCADAGLAGDIILKGNGSKDRANDDASANLYGEGKNGQHFTMDVTLLNEDLVISGVAVRGGSKFGENRWWIWEGEPFTGLTAPVDEQGKQPITHWFVCATEKETTPPPKTPATTPAKTTPPPAVKTEAPPAKKPVQLPTAVPAGVEGSGSDGSEPWAAAGLLAGLAMTGAGAWVLSRKQG